MHRRRNTEKTGMSLLFRVFFWLLLITASLLMVLPSLLDSASRIRQVREFRGFGEMENSLTEKQQKEMLKRAEEYNKGILEEQKRISFAYRGEEASDPVYESILSEGEDGIMGLLEIPSIGVYLPVAHGTGADILEYECGHMYGTSLPVGGNGTHSVIAGHTGLTSAVLFSHLRDLNEGDYFCLHLPGEIHRYRVCSVKVVLPEEESRFLQVEENRDLVTLYTCTPYGINDHRLLVTGERELPDPDPAAGENSTLKAEKISRSAVCRTVFLAAIPSALSAAGALSVSRAGKKKTRKRKGV